MVTNYIKGASYKEIYDIHTDTQSSSILTIHSPITNIPRQMLGGFFKQYRRFKYRGVRIKIRPAATLPADPAQISYEAGENAIDPRDMLNPMLFRGYCGDSLGTFLNVWNTPGTQDVMAQLTSGGNTERFRSSGYHAGSLDKTSFPKIALGTKDTRQIYLDALYYQSLSDPGFAKIKQQRGFSRFMRPLVYELATTTQYLAHNNNQDASMLSHSVGDQSATNDKMDIVKSEARRPANADFVDSISGSDMSTTSMVSGQPQVNQYSQYMPQMATPVSAYTGYNTGDSTNHTYAYRHYQPILTSRKQPLGWLDTDTRVLGKFSSQKDAELNTWGPAYNIAMPTTGLPFNTSDTVLPLINQAVLIMPRAYKQEMYMRLELTHVFDFKDYRPLSGLVSPFNDSFINAATLEWADWDDSSIVMPGPSVTSTAKNFELVDVQGSTEST